MNTPYRYEKPEGDQYKISIRKWNKVFGNRGRWPFVYVKAFVKGDTISTHYYYTVWAKLFITLIYPVLVVCEGYPEANKEVYRAWCQKKCGDFSSDITYRRHVEVWSDIEKLVGRKL